MRAATYLLHRDSAELLLRFLLFVVQHQADRLDRSSRELDIIFKSSLPTHASMSGGRGV